MRSEVYDALRELNEGGADTEAMLSFLRDSGVGLAESHVVIAELKRIPLDEALDCILQSKTWADQRQTLVQLNYDLLSALEELAEEGELDLDIAERDTEPDP